MIIPTLRIGKHDTYVPMVQCYQEHNIRLLRVNMARHTVEKYCEDINYIQNLSNHFFDIMADIPLPGRKYRLNLSNEKEVNIQKGQKVYFSTENDPDEKTIPVKVNSFPKIPENAKIVIGDGEVTLKVIDGSDRIVVASAENTTTIRGKRSFAVPGILSYEYYDEGLLNSYISAFKEIRPTKIVLSFSEDVEILTRIEGEFKKVLGSVQIIPKIETQIGVNQCDKICMAFNEIMLGRGDLALFSDPTLFGKNQRKVIDTANQKNTNVIAATDILTTLYNCYIPSRSDLSDIYYLKEMGIRDIVASAGISMMPDLFTSFCFYAKDFK